MSFSVKIIGSGSYLPDKIITNNDLAKIVETDDEWIFKRTGISERRVEENNRPTSYMAVKAIQKAIENAKIKKEDIDLIVCTTTTPDYTFPSTACVIQKELEIEKNIIAFDIQAVCCGFVYAISVASDMMRSGKIKNAIVVGADKMSSIINWTDRSTCILFGDGAGAMVLSSYKNNENNGENCDIIDYNLQANGKYTDILKTTGGVSTTGESGKLTMAGKEVFKIAVENISSSILDILDKNNLKTSDISYIIPHQANSRILEMITERLNLSSGQMVLNIKLQGNTSSASIPISFDKLLREDKIKRGDLIVLTAMGGGITWGSVLLRY